MKDYSLSEIMNLKMDEKIEIIEEIWDSIVASNESLELTDTQKKVLDQRLEEFQKNPGEGDSWEEVKARIKSKL